MNTESSLQNQSQAGEQMPGAWVCDKCGFTLQKNVLHVAGGAISANVADHCEGCPNDGSVMRPLTWREANEELFKRATELMAEVEEYKKTERAFQLLVKHVADTIPTEAAIQQLSGMPLVQALQGYVFVPKEKWEAALANSGSSTAAATRSK